MTKKLLLAAFTLLFISFSQAKKVKFAVDMGTYTISPFGIHVMGDFQVAAGYSLNFDPATVQMQQVGATSVYTVIVTLPAFQKYEYKFVNGDQSYEVEFVPEVARVGYSFNDNRFMYVDSLMNDTTYVGAVLFGANAPQGKIATRYVVDMADNFPPNSTGVHLSATYQLNNPATHKMVNLDMWKYEIIGYTNTGVQTYKFYNGNLAANTETVPAGCASIGNRTVSVVRDSILVKVCFSSCGNCINTGLSKNNIEPSSLILFPNPAHDFVTIKNPGIAEKIIVVDISGKKVDEIDISNTKAESIELNLEKYSKGIYQLYLKNGSKYYHSKLIVQ